MGDAHRKKSRTLAATSGVNDLEERIRARIVEAGPIPVAEYMALCLTHPDYGYYTNGAPIGGESGDFITAPEVSQMFGEMIAVWAIEVWQALGAPKRFCLVELGPGRGTLMRDLLRATSALPAFRDAMEIVFVEMSPTLAEQQALAVSQENISTQWISDLSALEEGVSAIFVGNEFLDALPAQQWVWLEGTWRLRAVGLVDDKLAYTTVPGAFDVSALPAQLQRGKNDGDILELSPACEALIATIAERLTRQHGAALFFDYGRTTPALCDTFQAVHRHAYADPLADPGNADLTFHVDFSALAAIAKKEGCTVAPTADQGAFLLEMGLLERAGSLGAGRNKQVQAELRAAVERLAGADAMGTLFKAFAFGAPATLGSRWPGFTA
jgi:SAM-dependent MidA family methyltransferase